MMISIEDFLKLKNDLDARFPKPFIDAILLTKGYLIPLGSIVSVEYEDKKYFIAHKATLDDAVKDIPMVKSDIVPEYLQGSLGRLIGIPIIEDDELVEKIWFSKFRMLETALLRNAFTSNIACSGQVA